LPYQIEFVYNERDLENFLHQPKRLKFPKIVKTCNGHDSIGMDAASKVHNEKELVARTRLMLDQFGGALVEEFIEGPEFTVLVVSGSGEC